MLQETQNLSKTSNATPKKKWQNISEMESRKLAHFESLRCAKIPISLDAQLSPICVSRIHWARLSLKCDWFVVDQRRRVTSTYRIDRPQKKVRNQMQINRAYNGECQVHRRSRTPIWVLHHAVLRSVLCVRSFFASFHRCPSGCFAGVVVCAEVWDSYNQSCKLAGVHQDNVGKCLNSIPGRSRIFP